MRADPYAVPHLFGVTEIGGPPARVVAAGFTELDACVALGVVPVAAQAWKVAEIVFPWSTPLLAGATPTMFPPGEFFDAERIAAAEPDLILVTSEAVGRDQYDTLSAIAPTVVSDRRDVFLCPWPDETMQIGRALGRARAAAGLVSDVERGFAAVRAQIGGHGLSAAVVAGRHGATVYAYVHRATRRALLTGLGFRVPAAIEPFAAGGDSADIDVTEITALDCDVLVLLDSARDLVDDPDLTALRAIRGGAIVIAPPAATRAIEFSTALSLQFALAELGPHLVQAARSIR
ncbi:MAG: ABC transporter substrate-binding protein [Ilumatobacteraceae bacterium]